MRLGGLNSFRRPNCLTIVGLRRVQPSSLLVNSADIDEVAYHIPHPKPERQFVATPGVGQGAIQPAPGLMNQGESRKGVSLAHRILQLLGELEGREIVE